MSNSISSLRILPAEIDGATGASAIGGAGMAGSPGASGTRFADTLRDAMNDVNQLQSEAESTVAGVIDGNGADVHSAMIAVEKADLSFQLMMQVRNKIVAAYQQISNMQF